MAIIVDEAAVQSGLQQQIAKNKRDINEAPDSRDVWRVVTNAQGYVWALFEHDLITSDQYSGVCELMREYARARCAELRSVKQVEA